MHRNPFVSRPVLSCNSESLSSYFLAGDLVHIGSKDKTPRGLLFRAGQLLFLLTERYTASSGWLHHLSGFADQLWD